MTLATSLENIETILRIYQDRGVKAVEAFQAGELDDAMKYLTLRKAAYYNFLAIDFELQKSDPDYLRREPFAGLWDALRGLNEKLERIIDDNRNQLGTDLTRLRKSRQKLKKFRSENLKNQNFQVAT